MRLEWLLLAEGVGVNATNAVTVISINQNVLTSPTLPVSTRRVIVAHFVGDPAENSELEGRDIAVSAQVVSPSGKTIFANTNSGKFVAPPWPDLPVGFDVAVVLELRIAEYGPHDVQVSAQTGDLEPIEGHTYLYVMEPPAPHV
jgi:hypothetical protein